jgi:hypothetical protein
MSHLNGYEVWTNTSCQLGLFYGDIHWPHHFWQRKSQLLGVLIHLVAMFNSCWNTLLPKIRKKYADTDILGIDRRSYFLAVVLLGLHYIPRGTWPILKLDPPVDSHRCP